MKVKNNLFLLLFFVTMALCNAQTNENKQNMTEKKYYVLIETSYGNMTVELFNETPKHRDNFLKLVNEGKNASAMERLAIPFLLSLLKV